MDRGKAIVSVAVLVVVAFSGCMAAEPQPQSSGPRRQGGTANIPPGTYRLQDLDVTRDLLVENQVEFRIPADTFVAMILSGNVSLFDVTPTGSGYSSVLPWGLHILPGEGGSAVYVRGVYDGINLPYMTYRTVSEPWIELQGAGGSCGGACNATRNLDEQHLILVGAQDAPVTFHFGLTRAVSREESDAVKGRPVLDIVPDLTGAGLEGGAYEVRFHTNQTQAETKAGHVNASLSGSSSGAAQIGRSLQLSASKEFADRGILYVSQTAAADVGRFDFDYHVAMPGGNVDREGVFVEPDLVAGMGLFDLNKQVPAGRFILIRRVDPGPSSIDMQLDFDAVAGAQFEGRISFDWVGIPLEISERLEWPWRFEEPFAASPAPAN